MKSAKRKIDGMLLATFLTTVFYSATYPFIHKQVIASVSDDFVAVNQIINCLSTIMMGWMWNKISEKLFKHYARFCVLEMCLTIMSTIYATLTHDIVSYYIVDTLVFAIVTRNIICGNVKLRAIRYNTETDREHFDNNNNSASAVATIIGSIIAMMLELDFVVMLWLATLGNAIDNIFYIFIYHSTCQKRE